MMKVGLLYETTNKPWGGINTFFRNFAVHAEKSREIELATNLIHADVLLSAGHYYGPGRLLKKFNLRNLSRGRTMQSPLGVFTKRGKKKIVFRVDGLRRIYAHQESEADDILIDNLDLADSVVFQSEFSKACFDDSTIAYPEHIQIIYNGTNSECFFPASDGPDFSKGTVLISNAWSTNLRKGFEKIALFSELEGVEVLHIGRWPDKIPSKEVKLQGTMREAEIPNVLRKGHYFLFPSENEACPNTVVEALACGLPVLYHDSGGTPELCRQGLFGIPIPSSLEDHRQLEDLLGLAKERYARMRASVLDDIETFGFAYCFDQYVEHFKALT